MGLRHPAIDYIKSLCSLLLRSVYALISHFLVCFLKSQLFTLFIQSITLYSWLLRNSSPYEKRTCLRHGQLQHTTTTHCNRSVPWFLNFLKIEKSRHTSVAVCRSSVLKNWNWDVCLDFSISQEIYRPVRVQLAFEKVYFSKASCVDFSI